MPPSFFYGGRGGGGGRESKVSFNIPLSGVALVKVYSICTFHSPNINWSMCFLLYAG